LALAYRGVWNRALSAGLADTQESVALFRQLDDRWCLTLALGYLAGVCARSGDRQTATAVSTEGLALARTLGDPQRRVVHLGVLGRLAWEEGDYGVARTRLEECLLATRQAGDRSKAAAALY